MEAMSSRAEIRRFDRTIVVAIDGTDSLDSRVSGNLKTDGKSFQALTKKTRFMTAFVQPQLSLASAKSARLPYSV
jgi:hypothetical protein